MAQTWSASQSLVLRIQKARPAAQPVHQPETAPQATLHAIEAIFSHLPDRTYPIPAQQQLHTSNGSPSTLIQRPGRLVPNHPCSHTRSLAAVSTDRLNIFEGGGSPRIHAGEGALQRSGERISTLIMRFSAGAVGELTDTRLSGTNRLGGVGSSDGPGRMDSE